MKGDPSGVLRRRVDVGRHGGRSEQISEQITESDHRVDSVSSTIAPGAAASPAPAWEGVTSIPARLCGSHVADGGAAPESPPVGLALGRRRTDPLVGGRRGQRLPPLVGRRPRAAAGRRGVGRRSHSGGDLRPRRRSLLGGRRVRAPGRAGRRAAGRRPPGTRRRRAAGAPAGRARPGPGPRPRPSRRSSALGAGRVRRRLGCRQPRPAVRGPVPGLRARRPGRRRTTVPHPAPRPSLRQPARPDDRHVGAGPDLHPRADRSGRRVVRALDERMPSLRLPGGPRGRCSSPPPRAGPAPGRRPGSSRCRRARRCAPGSGPAAPTRPPRPRPAPPRPASPVSSPAAASPVGAWRRAASWP